MWAPGVSDQLKPIIHLSDFVMGLAVARAFDLLTANERGAFGKVVVRNWAARVGGNHWLRAVLPGSISINTLLRPMNGLLLLGLGLGGGWIARFFSTRPIVYLGKASYGMYILHIPILWWAVSWPHFAVRYLYVAFVVAASCVVYALVEEPANQFIRSMVSKAEGGGNLVVGSGIGTAETMPIGAAGGMAGNMAGNQSTLGC